MVGFGRRAMTLDRQPESIGAPSNPYALSRTDTPASLSITTLSNAQNSFRAKPCCGSLEWSGCSGGPKHGKTTGIPPRTAFEPSRTAFEDTNNLSTSPPYPPFSVAFHEIIVAPNRRISAEAPYEDFGEMSDNLTYAKPQKPLGVSTRLFHQSFGKA